MTNAQKELLKNVVIVDAGGSAGVRTAISRAKKGGFKTVRSDDLAAHVIKGILERTKLELQSLSERYEAQKAERDAWQRKYGDAHVSESGHKEAAERLDAQLKEAKEAVENVPTTLKEAVSKAEAEEVKKKVEAQGATVEIK